MANERPGSALVRAKGRLKRALGWLTGDRHVEAIGIAEAERGEEPDTPTLQEAEHRVHERYGEVGPEVDHHPR